MLGMSMYVYEERESVSWQSPSGSLGWNSPKGALGTVEALSPVGQGLRHYTEP